MDEEIPEIVQIATAGTKYYSGHRLVALCVDGSLWEHDIEAKQIGDIRWKKIPLSIRVKEE